MSESVTLARDVRSGGTWSLPQRLKNDAIFAAASLSLVAVRVLPRSWLRAFGRGLGHAAFRILGHERRTALANLELAFPSATAGERTALARRSFVQLGDSVGDAAHAMTGGRFETLEMSEGDTCILHDALAEGRGVLFVSAHLGPWEQVAASVVAHGFPLVTIARESYDPRLTRLYDRLRGRHGVRSIYRGASASSVKALRCLKAGGMLGVVMDLASRVTSIDVPFLGKVARTAVGPARLALRTGARVVVASAAPTEAGLAITVTPIVTADLPAGPAGEIELTRRLNDELSRRIRALPHAWLWMHPRFDARPEK